MSRRHHSESAATPVGHGPAAAEAVTEPAHESGMRVMFERHLVAELRHAWPLDVVNGLALTAAVLSKSVVVWFHIVFLVLALAAFVLSFRRFVVRLTIWTTISAILVAWSVIGGHTPAVELTELPLMTAVLVLAYLAAQARGHVVDRLTATQAELVERAENELEALRHQLEQAQRLEFLGRASQSIAHDLRNVFTVINGCAAELDEQMHGRSAQGHVHEIAGATDRGMAIVSDLLLSARQRPNLDGPVDLAEITRHLEPLLRRLTGRGVELKLLCVDAPIRARIDRTSVLQVLMNLVANAADAIQGTGTITIGCDQLIHHQPGVAPRSVAVLTVTDDGPGIADSAIGSVFEHGFSTKGDDHTGLGLPTVWRIVERWGGRVTIESSPDRGTTVRVELPLFDGSNKALGVVVVADIRSRALLADELIARDFDVVATAEALEACDLLADREPAEVVLLDERSGRDQSLRHVGQLGEAGQVVVLQRAGADPTTSLPDNRARAKSVIEAALVSVDSIAS